jgi:hypothetical protein
MATVSCHSVCPTVSVRLRFTVNCALMPIVLGLENKRHGACLLLSGALPWKLRREEETE